jgi:hypothetical protein
MDAAERYCGRCHRFFRLLAPGLLTDDQGTAYLSLPTLLAAAGYEDTPENRATLLAAARERFAELSGTELIVRE